MDDFKNNIKANLSMRDMVLLQLVRARCGKNALLVAQKAGPICHVNNSDEKKGE